MRNTNDTQSNSESIPGPSRRSILRVAGWGGLASGLTLSARALGGRSFQDPGDRPGGDPEDPGRESDPAPLETRTMAQLYQAAIDEGGELVVEGGDSIHQEDGTKSAFLAQFPKINLSLAVDLSKYNDARIDLAFDKGTTPPDVAHLQTLQDFTRWKRQGRLLELQTAGMEHVYSQFKDPDGAWTGLIGLMFSNIANTTINSSEPGAQKLSGLLGSQIQRQAGLPLSERR